MPGQTARIPMEPMRVGVLVPANNTTVECELPLWLPEGSRLDILRIPRGAGLLTAQTVAAYAHTALDLATDFADREIDAVAYACTAASFILGPDGDRRIAADLARIAGAAVSTIAAAMIGGLSKLKVRRIAVITPYAQAVNAQLRAYLASADFEVMAMDSFYAATTEELAKISAQDVARLARATINEEAQAMFIACAQLPTHAVLEELARDFGRPVLSSVQCLAADLCEMRSSKRRSADPN